MEFSYLLNVSCLGNLQYSRKGYGKLIELLEWIEQAGADAVAVFRIPVIKTLIKKLVQWHFSREQGIEP
jgi:hypothetical protein